MFSVRENASAGDQATRLPTVCMLPINCENLTAHSVPNCTEIGTFHCHAELCTTIENPLFHRAAQLRAMPSNSTRGFTKAMLYH
jgi:hypothetical protein